MKAIQMSEFGGPEVLKCIEVDEPIPVANEVRVRLFAAGVNPNETYIRTGTYSFYILSCRTHLGLMDLGLWMKLARG